MMNVYPAKQTCRHIPNPLCSDPSWFLPSQLQENTHKP